LKKNGKQHREQKATPNPKPIVQKGDALPKVDQKDSQERRLKKKKHNTDDKRNQNRKMRHRSEQTRKKRIDPQNCAMARFPEKKGGTIKSGSTNNRGAE